MEPVARTAALAVRVFSVEKIPTLPYSVAASKLRRPFPNDRYCPIVVRPLKRWEKIGRPVENGRRSAREFRASIMGKKSRGPQKRWSALPLAFIDEAASI